ncbi:MAG: MarR family transcriptional regulator [Caldimonas sp.]
MPAASKRRSTSAAGTLRNGSEGQGERDASPGADQQANRVLRQFRQVFNAVKTHFQQVEKTVGLGGAQVWALSVIHAEPGTGVGALAAAMDIHQSTASNLVRTLAERELVAVSRDPVDRRVVRLKLSPAGAKLLRRSPGPFAGVLPDALASLDARTLKRIEADLRKLIAVLRVDDEAAQLPLGDL